MSVHHKTGGEAESDLLYTPIYEEYISELIKSGLEIWFGRIEKKVRISISQMANQEVSQGRPGSTISPIPSLYKLADLEDLRKSSHKIKIHKTMKSITKVPNIRIKRLNSANRNENSSLKSKWKPGNGTQKRKSIPLKTVERKIKKLELKKKSIEIKRKGRKKKTKGMDKGVDYLLQKRRKSTKRKIRNLDQQFRQSQNKFKNKMGSVRGVLKTEWKKMKMEGWKIFMNVLF